MEQGSRTSGTTFIPEDTWDTGGHVGHVGSRTVVVTPQILVLVGPPKIKPGVV